FCGGRCRCNVRRRNFSSFSADYIDESRLRGTMTPSTDDRLRIEAAQRDPSQFGELYEEHFYRVYAYIARRVGDRHQAEDLTADVFSGGAGRHWEVRVARSSLLGVAAADCVAHD